MVIERENREPANVRFRPIADISAAAQTSLMHLEALIPALALGGGTLWMLVTGTAKTTRRNVWSREHEPFAYWTFVGLGVLATLFFLVLAFQV